MILVYEFAHKGSLDKYLENTHGMSSLTWALRLQICLDAARGLDHIHSSIAEKYRIIHRDIKSANILLGQNWEAKIADFGLSRIGPANQGATYLMTLIAGTPGYFDPAYELSGMLKKESDVFSFGVVFLEVLSGRLAYDGTYDEHDDRRILHKWARQCYREGKQYEIVDTGLKGESEETFSFGNGVNQQSLDIFLKIADQCLEEKQDERPTMRTVVSELEKALHLQLNQVDTLKFSLKDLKLATDNFNKKNVIGKGRFGITYKGEISHVSGHSTVAVKRCLGDEDQGETEFLTELEILFDYKHENVISLRGYCNEADEKILVYEYASHGSLDSRQACFSLFN